MTRLYALAAAIAMISYFCAPALANVCDAPAYRSYDFFVGNWNVYNKNGKRFAHDIVTKDVDGCALLERWVQSGNKGVGYSAYDAQRKRWVQTFFQNDGTVLVFEGRVVKEGLLFTGDDTPRPGTVEHNRVLFRRLPDGFEEYWTTSINGGHTWKKIFDGFFRHD